MVTEADEVDEILKRMALIRRDRHESVRESVAGAEAILDWGRYTWVYPWIALGAAATAAAIAYRLYNAIPPRIVTDAAIQPVQVVQPIEAGPVKEAEPKSWGPARLAKNLLLTAWDVAFPVAVRAGQNHVLHWLESQYPSQGVDPAPVSRTADDSGSRWGELRR